MLSLLFVITSVVAQAPASGALKFKAPADWTVQPTTSSMRVAQYALPKAAGDAEDGELVVYFFGGTGGSVDANIERWVGQMQQPDGKSSKDVARRSDRKVNGLAVTLLDIAGTYTAEVRPGSAERHNKPGYRMRTAVVTTPKGPYFVKAVGPAKTIERWNKTFEAFIDSMSFQ
jgi:hypothetical protein